MWVLVYIKVSLLATIVWHVFWMDETGINLVLSNFSDASVGKVLLLGYVFKLDYWVILLILALNCLIEQTPWLLCYSVYRCFIITLRGLILRFCTCNSELFSRLLLSQISFNFFSLDLEKDLHESISTYLSGYRFLKKEL